MSRLSNDVAKIVISMVDPDKLLCLFVELNLDWNMYFSYDIIPYCTDKLAKIFSKQMGYTIKKITNVFPRISIVGEQIGYLFYETDWYIFCDKLTSLVIYDCNLFSDLMLFANIKQLEKLCVNECDNLENVNGLSMHKHLRFVELRRCNGLTNLGDLYKCENLRSLSYFSFAIIDMHKLSQCVKIYKLKFDVRLIALGTLSLMKKLKCLTLSGNMKNLFELGQCERLKRLKIINYKTIDVRELKTCKKLRYFEWAVPMSSWGNFARILSKDLNECVSLRNLVLRGLLIVELNGLDDSMQRLRNLELINCEKVSCYDVVKCKGLEIVSNGVRIMHRRGKRLEYIFDTNCLELRLNGYRDLIDVEMVGMCERLELIDLSGCVELSNINILGKCCALRNINLSNCCKVRNIEALGKCCELREINLSGCLDLKDISALSKCKELCVINLSGSGVMDVGILGKCVKLEDVDLGECKKLVNIVGLEKCERLGRVNIKGCSLKGIGVVISGGGDKDCSVIGTVEVCDKVVGFVLIEKKILWYHEFEDVRSMMDCGLDNVYGVGEHLRKLDLKMCVNLESFGGLGVCVNLESVDASGCMNLIDLRGLPERVRRVEIRRCRNLKDLRGMEVCVDLESIDMSGCVRLENVGSLWWCRKLSNVVMAGCKSVKNVKLFDCKRLVINGCGVEGIEGAGGLEYLEAKNCMFLRTYEIYDCLRHIDLGGCYNLENLVSVFGKYSALEYVDLYGCTVKNIEDFGKCSKLRYLNLNDCRSVDNVDFLVTLHELEELQLSGCRMSSVPALVCSSLKYLNLSRCLNLESAPDLSGCPGLVSVSVKECRKIVDVLSLKGVGKLNVRRSGVLMHPTDASY